MAIRRKKSISLRTRTVRPIEIEKVPFVYRSDSLHRCQEDPTGEELAAIAAILQLLLPRPPRPDGWSHHSIVEGVTRRL